MSLLWTLRKFADPVQWLAENEEKRAAREVKPGEPKDGGSGVVLETEAERPTEQWSCRMCAWESSAGSYCPKCLADTMRRRRR